jgi:TP901 family phage tail tape measure protein
MPSASTVAELQVVVGADTSAAESKLSSLGSGLGGALSVGVAAAGAAIAAGVAVGVKAAGDLEQSVANISTIKPEIDTSAVFASLNEMSTRIPQSAAQLGDSLYNIFSSLDVNTEGATKLLETFAQGAVGAQTDAQTFGTAIMGVMNAYGLSVDDASHLSDVFFNTVNKGVVTGQELAASLGPVTQSAKSAGVSVDELGAMIAAVTKEGGPAAQNVNNLNNFLQKVTTKEAQAQLKALGVATTDATGAFRPTADVLTDLKGRLADMTEAERANALQAIFPDAQARIGAATLLSQLDLVKSATEENRTSSGAAAAAYATMSATFNSQSQLLMNGLMAILTTIGGAILPMITPLVTAFSQWLPGAFQATIAAAAPIVQTLKDIGATVQQVFAGDWSPDASINPIVNAIGMIATVVRDQVLPALQALGAIAGPAFQAVADFALQYFGTIVAWVQANWPLILQTIQVVLANIAQLWAEHGQAITTVISSAWTIVTTVIQGALDIVLSAIRIAMQLITGDFSGAWETLVSVVERTMGRLGTIVGAAWDAVVAIIDDRTGGAITSVTTWLSNTTQAISDGWQAAQDAVSGAWDAITSTVSGAIDTVSSTLSGAWADIDNAISSAWQGFLLDISMTLADIQNAIADVWNAIPEDIRRDLELIATTLLERGRAWVENVTTTGANMLTAISTALGQMVDAVTTWATSTFIAPIQALVGTATTEATNVGTGMLTSFTTQFAAIVTAVGTWVTSFLAPITALVGTATAQALAVGSGILTSIQTKLGEAVNAVSTWGGNVVSAISGIVGSVGSAAASIGQAIVSGIANAISGGIGAIRDAAYRAARAALDAAKDALGVHSPSRVFREEVGRMIPAGVIQGVQDMARPLAEALGGMMPVPSVGSYGGSYGSAVGGSVGMGGGSQTIRLEVAIGGRVAEEIYVTGRELAIRRGRVSGVGA